MHISNSMHKSKLQTTDYMPGILMCLLYALGHLICSRYYEVGTSSDHRNLRLISQSVQSLSHV